MKASEHSAEHRRQYDKHQTSRNKYERERLVQHYQHDQRGYKTNCHSRKAGEYINVPVGCYNGVVGKAVQPLAGMHGADRREILSQYFSCQPLLESILKRCQAQFIEPSDHSLQGELTGHENEHQYHPVTEGSSVMCRGTVHGIPEQQSINHAVSAEHYLHSRQQRDQQFFSARNDPEPPYSLICSHVLAVLYDPLIE